MSTYTIKPLEWVQEDNDGPEVARGCNGYEYHAAPGILTWFRNGELVGSTAGTPMNIDECKRRAQSIHEKKLAAYLTEVV